MLEFCCSRIFWNFPGYSRHHGIVFLAFVASVWAARAERPSTRSSIFAFRALLLISAVGGVLTLTSELIPFSQGRNVAEWLRMNGRSDAFLVGSRDAQVSTVAGYLGRHMGTSNNTSFRRVLPQLSERLQRSCEGEFPIGDRFDVWRATARSFCTTPHGLHP